MNTPPAGEDSPVLQYLIALTECEKPIVVEVSGPAVGIGVTMLLHCDLVYADETAGFRMPFVDLGLVPEGASSFLLPRMVGYAKANELLLTSKKFGAAEAKEIGLITAIVDADQLHEHCASTARTLAKKAPAAVKRTKDLLRRHTREEVKRALKEEGELFIQQLRSPEATEAFTAFFEKREPDFSSSGGA
jgi:enoyl-CoA hydratase/carnithine racemase